jgi:formylglycine-generating enzyme required for sulfatase activity
VPAGRFLMGSLSTELGHSPDEGPQRMVSVAPFAIGKYEVTQAQWLAVMGTNPSHFDSCERSWLGAAVGNGDNCPVESVSWDDAQDFLRRLSQRAGVPYRLPSEAEWEYAARAGTSTPYPWGDQVGTGNANCSSCGSRWDSKGPAPVGKFSANAFGLHDMLGNVQEWVQDLWHESYVGAPSDGSPWLRGGDASMRVLRGGTWADPARGARSAYRNGMTAGFRNGGIGLRVARSLQRPE